MLPLVFDCEIIKAIPTKDERIEGIEYCEGWTDYEGMGVSVTGFQLGTDEPDYVTTIGGFLDLLVYLDDSEVEYRLVGFNSKRFDDKLLNANGLEGIETHYDLLEEIRVAAGHSATSAPKGYSYKLDDIAKANGMAKSGSGALAPVLWQQGKRQEVINYCLQDVAITKKMLDLGLDGALVDPNTGRLLQLRPLV